MGVPESGCLGPGLSDVWMWTCVLIGQRFVLVFSTTLTGRRCELETRSL